MAAGRAEAELVIEERLVMDNYGTLKTLTFRKWFFPLSPFQGPFHADLGVMAQSGRTLVCYID